MYHQIRKVLSTAGSLIRCWSEPPYNCGWPVCSVASSAYWDTLHCQKPCPIDDWQTQISTRYAHTKYNHQISMIRANHKPHLLKVRSQEPNWLNKSPSTILIHYHLKWFSTKGPWIPWVPYLVTRRWGDYAKGANAAAALHAGDLESTLIWLVGNKVI